MPPTPEDRRAQTRRLAAALRELAADAFALAVRATTGHTLREPAGTRAPAAVTSATPGFVAVQAPGCSTAPPPGTSAEDAAARIDAARERLRSRIPAPTDDPERKPPTAQQRA